MADTNVLSIVAGYDKVLTEKDRLATLGTDFSEQKGSVAAQIAQLHPKRLSLVVSKIIEETASTKTLRLVSADGYLPPFQAGQYVNLFVTIDGVNTARPYAISSAPSEREYYDVTIRRVAEGYVSNYLLDKINEGAPLQSTGPMGTFYHNPVFHGDDLVFLAGGSGVAPAISMIADIIDHELPYKFHLIYGSRNIDDIIFRSELKALERANDFLTVTEVISEPPEDYAGRTGFITAELISQLTGPLDNKMFYMCGPSVMYDFCRKELARAGVARRRIRIEANGPPKSPDRLEGWPDKVGLDDEVTVKVQGRGSFIAKTGEPLLNSLERNGYFAENACRSGECSLCRVKVLSGEVFNPPEAHLRVSDRQFGWCHSCVAFPLEDIEILI